MLYEHQQQVLNELRSARPSDSAIPYSAGAAGAPASFGPVAVVSDRAGMSITANMLALGLLNGSKSVVVLHGYYAKSTNDIVNLGYDYDCYDEGFNSRNDRAPDRAVSRKERFKPAIPEQQVQQTLSPATSHFLARFTCKRK